MIELDPNRDRDLQLAERKLREAEQELVLANEALLDAQVARIQAQGRVYYHTFKPKRHDVLNPSSQFDANTLYTYCMQLGYRFGMLNDTVHFAGKPGELMVDTGIKLDQVPS